MELKIAIAGIVLCAAFLLVSGGYYWGYSWGHRDGYNWTMTYLSRVNYNVPIGKIINDLTWTPTEYEARQLR